MLVHASVYLVHQVASLSDPWIGWPGGEAIAIRLDRENPRLSSPPWSHRLASAAGAPGARGSGAARGDGGMLGVMTRLVKSIVDFIRSLFEKRLDQSGPCRVNLELYRILTNST